MDLKNEMHCELAKANTMDHGGVIICFDDSEVSYRDVRCVFYTLLTSIKVREREVSYIFK